MTQTASPTSTELALQRTRLAYERTLMAWIRTSMSLITFGFTIYKFFQYLHAGKPTAETGLIGPRAFALLMIVIGLTALVLANIEHSRSIRALGESDGRAPRSIAAVVAGLVSILAIVGLAAVLFRL